MSRPPLTWVFLQRENETCIALKGDISEAADFEALAQLMPKRVALELEGIERVNSAGVREWIGFLASLQRAGVEVALERCAVAMVGQLNMISNFVGHATVRSIYAPYFCAKCDAPAQKLFPVEGLTVERLLEPMPCPTCGEPMEFDDLAEPYLSFLSRAR